MSPRISCRSGLLEFPPTGRPPSEIVAAPRARAGAGSMTPERWQKVKELFEAALELEPAQRASFLRRGDAYDEGVRREVESLLSSYEETPGFMETPPAENWSAAQHKLSAGQRFSHYEIASLVGEGGMGEVYAAYDTKLGRKVALKLLPPDFTGDPDRVRRFMREARAASSLNHPNILTVHEIGVEDSTHFIATELIDGVTLRRRMGGGASGSTRCSTWRRRRPPPWRRLTRRASSTATSSPRTSCCARTG